MRIIPAIDILDGKCVRLTKGDYSTSKIYNEDPVEVAKAFEDAGITYLHMVDLDGARSSHIVNSGVLEAVSSATDLRIDFGGGVKTEEDLRIAFESGAHQVTGGSIAAKEPEKFNSWIQKYGPEKIILGADAHKEKIAVNGWNEASDLDLIPYVIGYLEKGINYVICTDISKDGMLSGPSTALYKRMLNAVSQLEINMSLIASGGISTIADLEKLKRVGCEGAILGKAIYENKISLAALEKWILAYGN